MQSAVHESVLIQEFLYAINSDVAYPITNRKYDGSLGHMFAVLEPIQEQMMIIRSFVDDVLLNGGSVILESLVERILQFTVNVSLRCVHWESELMKGNLTLTSLRYQISEVSELVKVLHEVVTRARDVPPCAVIDIVSGIEIRYAHSGEIRNTCRGLKEAAFEPLGRLVVDCVLAGDLSGDKYGEFFVGPDFSLRSESAAPSSLVTMKDLIARTGNSCSLLNSLGVKIRQSLPEGLKELDSSPNKLLDSNYAASALNQCSSLVESLLLDRVNRHGALEKELQLLQDHFFLAHSGWYMELLDVLGDELEKPVKLINRVKVDTAVACATKGLFSAAFHQFPIEEFRLDKKVSEDNLIAVRCFTLDRVVPNGVSLVVTEEAVFKVQTVFRHLFFGKHIEGKLSNLWTDFQTLRELDTEHCLLPCQALLQRMTHFVSNYLFYLCIDVVAAKPWSQLIPKSKSVWEARDQVTNLLQEVLDEFSLDTGVYKSVNKVLSTCGLFSAHMSRFIAMQLSGGGSFDERADALTDAARQPKFEDMIAKFQEAFQTQANSLIVQLRAQLKSHKGAHSLIARLDFNSFFSDKMAI